MLYSIQQQQCPINVFMNIVFIGCTIFCGNTIISSTIFLLLNIWVIMYLILPSVIIILLRFIWQQYDLGKEVMLYK